MAKTKLERVLAQRRRLEFRSKAVDALTREVKRDTMAAIFEQLGISARPQLGYNDHSAQGVKISASEYGEGFTIETRVGHVELSLFVKCEDSDQLAIFKKMLEARAGKESD